MEDQRFLLRIILKVLDDLYTNKGKVYFKELVTRTICRIKKAVLVSKIEIILEPVYDLIAANKINEAKALLEKVEEELGPKANIYGDISKIESIIDIKIITSKK